MIAGAVERPLELVQRDGPLEPLIALAGPTAGADHATVHSRDGQYRASVPLDRLRAGRLEHGRLHVPDAPGDRWDVEDVVRIELTAGARPDSLAASVSAG